MRLIYIAPTLCPLVLRRIQVSRGRTRNACKQPPAVDRATQPFVGEVFPEIHIRQQPRFPRCRPEPERAEPFERLSGYRSRASDCIARGRPRDSSDPGLGRRPATALRPYGRFPDDPRPFCHDSRHGRAGRQPGPGRDVYSRSHVSSVNSLGASSLSFSVSEKGEKRKR